MFTKLFLFHLIYVWMLRPHFDEISISIYSFISKQVSRLYFLCALKDQEKRFKVVSHTFRRFSLPLCYQALTVPVMEIIRIYFYWQLIDPYFSRMEWLEEQNKIPGKTKCEIINQKSMFYHLFVVLLSPSDQQNPVFWRIFKCRDCHVIYTLPPTEGVSLKWT